MKWGPVAMSSPGWSARCSSNDGAGPAAAPPIHLRRRRFRRPAGRSSARGDVAVSELDEAVAAEAGVAPPRQGPRGGRRRAVGTAGRCARRRGRCTCRGHRRDGQRAARPGALHADRQGPAGGDGGFIKANLSDLVLGLDDLRAASTAPARRCLGASNSTAASPATSASSASTAASTSSHSRPSSRGASPTSLSDGASRIRATSIGSSRRSLDSPPRRCRRRSLATSRTPRTRR